MPMPKKRRLDARRDRKGKIIYDRAIDRGTPELQAMRQRTLGARAHPMERLSHQNPVDILAALEWFEPGDIGPAHTAGQIIDAARAYQHHHACCYGSLTAQAMAIGTITGPGMSTRRRLKIRRELDLWERIVAGYPPWHRQVFRAYVLEQQPDATIHAAIRAKVSRELDGAHRIRITALRNVLTALAAAPPVWVSREEVEAAEREESR